MVKPSAIYYNSAEVLKGLLGAQPDAADKGSSPQIRDFSSTLDRRGSSASSTSSSRFRSSQDTDSAVVSVQQDSVHYDEARVAALEERMKVSHVIFKYPGQLYSKHYDTPLRSILAITIFFTHRLYNILQQVFLCMLLHHIF